MTSGLDNGVPVVDCTLPSCLVYKADAGTRWAYLNAPYTLLDKVVINATETSFSNYFQQKIRTPIGMNGVWPPSGSNNVFYSNARNMARYGLLLLNKAKWDQTPILDDSTYFNAQTNTSQNLNLSYGYLMPIFQTISPLAAQVQTNFGCASLFCLFVYIGILTKMKFIYFDCNKFHFGITWLNGKASHMLPTLQNFFSGSMTPNAPADMYAALGKNDQKVYVVPSQ